MWYVPGVRFVVNLRAEPPFGTTNYSAQDHPPTNWTVGAISHGGPVGLYRAIPLAAMAPMNMQPLRPIFQKRARKARISPLPRANVRDASLRWIWEDSPMFSAFRGTDWMQDPCRSCSRRG